MPDPRQFTRNGSLSTPGGQIALWNATPQRESLLRWALQRFSESAILPPAPRSVAFAPFGEDPGTEYGFIPGAPDLLLPATRKGCGRHGCDQWPVSERVATLDALARLGVTELCWSTVRTTQPPSTSRAAARRPPPKTPTSHPVRPPDAQRTPSSGG